MRASPICVVFLGVLSASCRTARVASTPSPSGPPPIVQPGAPGQPSRVISAAAAADVSKVDYIDADIKFMQGMIGHHAQAIEMVAFIPTHTSRREMVLLGQRIDISQTDEIKMMQDWLRAARSAGAGRECHARARRHAHAGHAHRRGNGAAGAGERGRVRSPVPRGDDQAPRGRDHDGQGVVCHARARDRMSASSRSPTTWTSISGWKSSAWARCSTS